MSYEDCVSKSAIKGLRSSALKDGDTDTVELCNQALQGDEEALETVAEIIAILELDEE